MTGIGVHGIDVLCDKPGGRLSVSAQNRRDQLAIVGAGEAASSAVGSADEPPSSSIIITARRGVSVATLLTDLTQSLNRYACDRIAPAMCQRYEISPTL